jgi:membrane protease YdiL (CAAX protease family)
MYDSNSKGISYTAGFFILIAFAVAGLFIGTLISIPIWTSMTGKGLLEMRDQISNPAYSNAFKMVQAVSTFFGFFIPAIITAILLNRKPYKLLGFTRKFDGRQIGLVILVMFMALFVSGTLGYMNQHIPIPASWKIIFDRWEDEYNKQVQAIMQLKNFSDYLLALVIMAFLPALCEETLFRGGLQNFLTRSIKKPWLSIIIVSIIFSIVHFSFYGFLPRMFLGIMLGLIFHYTGSIWLCIIAHFFNNALAVTQLYYYTSHGKALKDVADQNTPFLWGLVALPILVIALVALKKISPPPQEEALSLDTIRDKAPWEINK